MTPPRLFYAHGPGDAAGTLRAWAEGVEDDSIVASAYSAQFFDIARELGAQALVTVDSATIEPAEYGSIRVVGVGSDQNASGWRYIAQQRAHGRRLAALARDFRADAALVAGHHGLHGLAPFAAAGVPVILTMHNTLWPMGVPPGLMQRLSLAAGAAGARRAIRSVIVVTPECELQLRRVMRLDRPVHVHVAQYPLEMFRHAPPPERGPGDPFVVLFAGRIEPVKGVFDVVEAAALLKDRGSGHVRFVIAGTGSADQRLREAVSTRGLGDMVRVTGHLRRADLTAELRACHATITPTQRGFPEGNAKAPLEAVIVGRPAITSSIVPTGDVVRPAAVIVPPESPAAVAEAVLSLASDPARYAQLCRNALDLHPRLFTPERSFRAALLRALADTGIDTRGLPDARPEPVDSSRPSRGDRP
jgi:glycosyltransferase involved in cell wall biosynthesis